MSRGVKEKLETCNSFLGNHSININEVASKGMVVADKTGIKTMVELGIQQKRLGDFCQFD